MWVWYFVAIVILFMVITMFISDKRKKPFSGIREFWPQLKEEVGEELTPKAEKITHSPIEKFSGQSIPYFETTLILVEESPEKLSAHWTIGENLKKELTEKNGPEFWHNCQPVLRLYHTNAVPQPYYEDFPIDLDKGNVQVSIQAPGETLNAEIGLITEKGSFISLVHSNDVTIPHTN